MVAINDYEIGQNDCKYCLMPRSQCECVDEFDLEDDFCETCWNTGWISICFDDLCQGEDGCIHGDGNVVCPECHGQSAF